jgi:hypothetical protein
MKTQEGNDLQAGLIIDYFSLGYSMFSMYRIEARTGIDELIRNVGLYLKPGFIWINYNIY